MKQQIIVMHMSGAYEEQTFYKQNRHMVHEVDCKNIEGTNCYCDEMAKEELRRRIAAYSYEGIHFLDSGNYHYLSLLWLEKIDRPFALVLFDHHPDLQAPSWGKITSCGGWVREALETNSYLEKVYLVGVDAQLLSEVRLEDQKDQQEENGDLPCETSDTYINLWERIQTGLPDFTEEKRPIYISFDKDVLNSTEAVCDWDQGDMSLEEAIHNIKEIATSTNEFLGMDVCGEDSSWSKTREAKTCEVNDWCNKRLQEVFPFF